MMSSCPPVNLEHRNGALQIARFRSEPVTFFDLSGVAPHQSEVFSLLHKTLIAEWSRACVPPKVMKNVSLRQPPSTSRCLLLCHPDRSEAEGRDLRFAPSATNLERKTYAPLVIPTGVLMGL